MATGCQVSSGLDQGELADKSIHGSTTTAASQSVLSSLNFVNALLDFLPFLGDLVGVTNVLLRISLQRLEDRHLLSQFAWGLSVLRSGPCRRSSFDTVFFCCVTFSHQIAALQADLDLCLDRFVKRFPELSRSLGRAFVESLEELVNRFNRQLVSTARST